MEAISKKFSRFFTTILLVLSFSVIIPSLGSFISVINKINVDSAGFENTFLGTLKIDAGNIYKFEVVRSIILNNGKKI
jgi:hypothetical protein